MPGLQVSYQLVIDGQPASTDVLDVIKSLEVEDHAVLADMLRLRLATSIKRDGSGWTVVDDSLFGRLANLKVSVTIGSGKTIPLISAYVIETDIQFASEPNNSEITVVAMDPSVLMHLEERVKQWPNQADSDVASAVFSDPAYGFTADVQATHLVRNDNDHTLIQRGTDMQFLQHLAERNGYDCFLDLDDAGNVQGHFHEPRRDGQPQGTLTVAMGSATNVNRFRARFDMLGPTTAQATTLDVTDGSRQDGSSDQTNQDGMGQQVTAPADRPRRVLLAGLGMGESAEVQRYAQAVVDRSSWAIVAEGELNTVAYGGILRAKTPVLVRGVGLTFSGRYYVEKVLHTIGGDGSYTQRFTLRRNALGLTGQERFQQDQALS
jgi:phage protein D